MNIAATILLFYGTGCFGMPKTPDEAYNSLFEVSGYPNAGDVPTLNRKIFKGVRVAIREHPYIVSIRRQFSHYLTGTLVSSTLVLTVAHPLHLVPIYELGVVMGENYADRGTLVHTVVLFVVHEDFDPFTLHNDIAMLKLYEDANLRTSVKFINLYTTIPLNGTSAFVTGWGRCDMTGRELCLPRGSIYYPDEKLDPMLKTIMFKMTLSNYYCDGYMRQDIVLHPGMLCAGEAREENPVMPCLAVPGAPLVIDGNLAGLLSWGFGCGYSHDLPLVYTGTQYYSKWIWHNMETFNMLTQRNYTELFEATRAYIACAWLMETRLVTPDPDDDILNKLQKTDLDKGLANLHGTYYDIRDFVDKERLHQSKLKMINEMWRRNRKLYMINATKLKFPLGVPFLSKDLVADEDNEEKNQDNDIEKVSP